MGKKKGAANKLAKMSDEERARYLQHRADLEEEARRRKQQLIAIFLKVRFFSNFNFTWEYLKKKIIKYFTIFRIDTCFIWIISFFTFQFYFYLNVLTFWFSE